MISLFIILIFLIPILISTQIVLRSFLKPNFDLIPRIKFFQYLYNLVIIVFSFVLLYNFKTPLKLSTKMSYWFNFNTTNVVYFILVSFIGICVMHFSIEYLRKEKWIYKFQLNMTLFLLGLNIISISNNFILFAIGWELIGTTSVFLISFYQERESTVKNSFRTLVTYKIGDIFLLVIISYLHSLDIVSFDKLSILSMHELNVDFIIIFFLIAAYVKSSQYPFSYWLPRAMEGPTSTSAVFYGSLSVHAGLFLILKISNYIPFSNNIKYIIILFSTLTIIHSYFVGRVTNDVKKYLAYSSMLQIALIFIEIAFNFQTLALIHLVSHSILRCYQLLLSPSIFQLKQEIEYVIDDQTTQYFKFNNKYIIKLQNYLYYISLEEGKLHFLRKYLIIAPFRIISTFLNNISSWIYNIPIFLKTSIFRNILFVIVILSASLVINNLYLKKYFDIVVISSFSLSFLLAISAFKERNIFNFYKSFAISIIVINLFQFKNILLYMHREDLHDYLFPSMLVATLITLTYFIIIVARLFKENNLENIYISKFYGLFDSNPQLSKIILILTLILTAQPLGFSYFMQEHGVEFLEKFNLIYTFSYIAILSTLYLALFRFIFLILFGKPTSTT